MKIFQFSCSRFIRFFLYNIQNGMKEIQINLPMKQEIHAAQCGPLYLDFRGNRHPVT